MADASPFAGVARGGRVTLACGAVTTLAGTTILRDCTPGCGRKETAMPIRLQTNRIPRAAFVSALSAATPVAALPGGAGATTGACG